MFQHAAQVRLHQYFIHCASALSNLKSSPSCRSRSKARLTIRIDENIDDTLANVDSAQAQLLKYMNSISSNRWLVMKVFAVLLFFLFVFIFFIA